MAVLLAALLFVLVTGWADYVTGPDYSFALFYLIAVVACGLLLGSPNSLVMSLFTATVWLAADLLPREPIHGKALAWNALTRLAVLASMGELTALMRRDRDELASVAARLEQLLAGETELARTDALTGLKNRRGFREVLELELARSFRARTPVCLAYIDIDNFKTLNDARGHAAGDDFLQRVAEGLRETIRASDVPARLGGDELGVLLSDVTLELAQVVADRLLDMVAAVARLHPSHPLGASIGLAYFERPPEDANAVIAAADLAMYQAKERGKGQVAVWLEGKPLPLPAAARGVS